MVERTLSVSQMQEAPGRLDERHDIEWLNQFDARQLKMTRLSAVFQWVHCFGQQKINVYIE